MGTDTLKRCRKCGEHLPLSCFYVHSPGSDRLRTICKTCHTEEVKERRAPKVKKIHTIIDLIEGMAKDYAQQIIDSHGDTAIGRDTKIKAFIDHYIGDNI